MQHAVHMLVVHIGAPAAQQPQVLDPLDGLADHFWYALRASYTASTIGMYPVQRQRLPESTSRMRALSASGSSLRSACAVVSMPGVQKPHCKAWCLRKAACS